MYRLKVFLKTQKIITFQIHLDPDHKNGEAYNYHM